MLRQQVVLLRNLFNSLAVTTETTTTPTTPTNWTAVYQAIRQIYTFTRVYMVHFDYSFVSTYKPFYMYPIQKMSDIQWWKAKRISATEKRETKKATLKHIDKCDYVYVFVSAGMEWTDEWKTSNCNNKTTTKTCEVIGWRWSRAKLQMCDGSRMKYRRKTTNQTLYKIDPVVKKTNRLQ